MSPRISLRLLSLSAVMLPLLQALPGPARQVVPAPAKPASGRKHALLVGVRDYDSAKLPPLRFTENDIVELSEVLTEQAGFTSVRVLSTSNAALRKGRAKANAPTRANIGAELKRLLANKKKDDTVLVGLSGHGIQREVNGKQEGFFCPSDAQLNDPKTLLGLSELLADLDRCGAGVKLLLVDACRNDPNDGRSVGLTAPSRLPDNTAVLFSCKRGQRAFETAKLGKGHGIFFFHVIDGLRGKAKNNRGEVTWSSLADHVIDKVSDDVPSLIGGGAKQIPEQKLSLSGRSPVLVPSPTANLSREVVNSVGMKLVRIGASTFSMGSSEKDQAAAIAAHGRKVPKGLLAFIRSEGPQHPVQISRDYWLGVTEVTQKQFKAVMRYNPSVFSADGTGRPDRKHYRSKPAAGKVSVKGLDTGDFPVENVSWNEAVEFCEKLSDRKEEKAAGRAYRLPTEAQWEHACRAGTTTAYSFGDKFTARLARAGLDENDPDARTCKVGSFAPNAWGLFDMHGNVFEWCADQFQPEYYASGPRTDPPGSARGSQRVIRGGAWSMWPVECRSASRAGRLPGVSGSRTGFRVLLVPAQP
jgi:formylglycine-generating enzyme required for sulfatase activity